MNCDHRRSLDSQANMSWYWGSGRTQSGLCDWSWGLFGNKMLAVFSLRSSYRLLPPPPDFALGPSLSSSFQSLETSLLMLKWGFPHSSVGKESACNAGDPGSIPGLGRSTGDGIGYPLQYSEASLVAQLVKNPPAMWEPPSLGRSPGEGKGYPL